MKVFRKKSGANHISRAQALACTPVKSLQIIEVRLDTGEVLIEYPLAVRPWIAAVARRLGGPQNHAQTKKLQLDTMGTSVWDLMDGNRSVSRIIKVFAETHRLENREAEISVTHFIKELGRRGLLGLQ
ncbi:MAG: PqqD family protein [Deltaproteobacteria bacterium]|nr:PqqD family protein [Deltaproteobacteria bacterium]